MKQIEIVYGNSLTINRGSYENEKPLYSQKVTYEVEDNQVIDERAEYDRLRSIVDPLVMEHYNRAKLDLSNVRVRIIDGQRLPSVTSILTPDGIPRIEPAKLACYARRGHEYERLFFHWAKTGEVLEPDTNVDIGTLKWDLKFKQFIEKEGKRLDFKKATFSVEVSDKKLAYSGEVDINNVLIDGIPHLCDVKTGQWKWEQLLAYNHALGVGHTCPSAIFDLKNGMMILSVNEKEATIEHCWHNFLMKRGEFKGRFGF